jgi:general stress protein YciG
LLKTVKEHQKQVEKVASSGGNFKNDPQRASEAGKKAKIATATTKLSGYLSDMS